jgi:hypothetical protein
MSEMNEAYMRALNQKDFHERCLHEWPMCVCVASNAQKKRFMTL